jgi:hypothetical protein
MNPILRDATERLRVTVQEGVRSLRLLPLATVRRLRVPVIAINDLLAMAMATSLDEVASTLDEGDIPVETLFIGLGHTAGHPWGAGR